MTNRTLEQEMQLFLRDVEEDEYIVYGTTTYRNVVEYAKTLSYRNRNSVSFDELIKYYELFDDYCLGKVISKRGNERLRWFKRSEETYDILEKLRDDKRIAKDIIKMILRNKEKENSNPENLGGRYLAPLIKE